MQDDPSEHQIRSLQTQPRVRGAHAIGERMRSASVAAATKNRVPKPLDTRMNDVQFTAATAAVNQSDGFTCFRRPEREPVVVARLAAD